MEYTHKGVKIVFDEAGAKFRAIINGATHRAASLDAMKAKINATEAKAFAPWRGLCVSGYGDKSMREVEVKGVRRIGRNTPEWLVRYIVPPKHGSDEGLERAVVPDSPENRALIVTWFEARQHKDEVVADAERAVNAALNVIPFKRAE